MSLSVTTRRKQQTLSAKWSTQQHLTPHQNNDLITPANINLLGYHSHPVAYKQKSFIETLHLSKTLLTAPNARTYLSRGLSVGRSHDIPRSSLNKEVLKKHTSLIAQSFSGRNDRETFKTSADTVRRNTTTSNKINGGGGENLRKSRRIQSWSSTTSILKCLDKELAHLNGAVGKPKNIKNLKSQQAGIADKIKINKPEVDTVAKIETQNVHSNSKQTKAEVNKVNLNIVLSHTLDATKEENDYVVSDQEVDEDDGGETASDNGKIVNSCSKTNDNKKLESSTNCLKHSTLSRSNIVAQQRRALYQANNLATNLTLNNNNSSAALKIVIQNSQNFNVSPSLIVPKRSSLVRAMSAPVRSFDAGTKGPAAFLNSKRKSRRRKLNTRDISCDKEPCNLLPTNNINIDSKSKINRKILTRSKSVATDVVTLVSLVSSEGSDSEKEDSFLTSNNSLTASPSRRAPCLRKAGKSVSFQENYPTTFQFVSKEYSHMLRRGSIVPLTQRIKSNRPPTAPAGSIYHIAQKVCSEMPTPNTQPCEEKERDIEDIKNKVTATTLAQTPIDKSLKEEYEFPEYVRSLKERECWKLFMKMSTKGVNITYDTILRGMLTPTEFRQLQKQRDIEEAKAIKEARENNSATEEISKSAPTAIERLQESLLKK